MILVVEHEFLHEGGAEILIKDTPSDRCCYGVDGADHFCAWNE